VHHRLNTSGHIREQSPELDEKGPGLFYALTPQTRGDKTMSKPMRAKMQIQSVAKQIWGGEVVKMAAVYGGSTNDEDNSFAKTTPCGSLELHGVYQPGDTFYVDFTPVQKT